MAYYLIIVVANESFELDTSLVIKSFFLCVLSCIETVLIPFESFARLWKLINNTKI